MAELDAILEKLESYSTEDALVVLDAITQDRKERHFARYWSCDSDPDHQQFFDSIEESFSKFTKDIKIFAMRGGNRSSKTERGAFLAVAWLFGKEYFRNEPSWRYVKDLPIPEHGANIWLVGLDFSVISDVLWKEKLRTGHRHPGLLPRTPCSLITRISDSSFQVECDVNGRRSYLCCKSADSGAAKFQSASIDLAVIDEEIDVEVFNEVYQRTSDCSGKIVLTMTPLNDIGSSAKTPWVYDLNKAWKAGQKDLCFISLNTLDNPFIPGDEKEKLKVKWAGHPEERARLYGEFIQRAGLVYPQFNWEKHSIKPFSIPSDWRRIGSIDPAATGPNACLWLAVKPNKDIIVYREYEEANKIISDHTKDILIRNSGDRIDLWIIDPYAGAARSAETHKQTWMIWKEAGIPVRLAPRTEDFGRNTLGEYLSASLDTTSRHPKIFFFNTLHGIKEELESYVWDFISKGPMKGLSKDKPMKRKDHLINSLQYAVSLNPRPKSSSVPIYNVNNSYT